MGVKVSLDGAAPLGVDTNDANVLRSDEGMVCSFAPEHFLKPLGQIWGSVVVYVRIYVQGSFNHMHGDAVSCDILG